jgi:glyoxylase-like metal-dependent hydrolase (beta-lactamase superfamily II)
MTVDARLGGTEEDVKRYLRERYGIHVLRIQTPLPALKVNVYFIERPVATLVDAPPDRSESLDEMETALNGLGFSTRDIRVIIVTHPHFDHYGSAQTLVDRSGAEIWAGRETGEWMTGFERECLEEEDFNVRVLMRAGVSENLIEASRQHFRHMKQFARGVCQSRILETGATITLSSMDARVCEVPGHTPWCTMLYAEDEGIAFTGDFLLADISPNPLIQRRSKVAPGYNSLRTYIDSLKKIGKMEMRLALPGHGPLIRSPKERIENLLELIEARRNAVLSAVQSGSKTPFEFVQQLFPDLPPSQIFLAVSEVLAHVEALCIEGILERMDDSPDRYRIA